MIFFSHKYRQCFWDFFKEMQNETYRNVHRIPCLQEDLNDLQAMYWMGGEL